MLPQSVIYNWPDVTLLPGQVYMYGHLTLGSGVDDGLSCRYTLQSPPRVASQGDACPSLFHPEPIIWGAEC